MLKIFTARRTRYLLAFITAINCNGLWAAWGPESPNYKEEAPLVGTWVGQANGKPIEFSVWPNTKSEKLSGVMVWGNCTAGIDIERLKVTEAVVQVIDNANPKQNENIFSFTSFLLNTEKLTSQCPEAGRPGYGGFYLQSDQKTEELTTFSQNNSSTLVKGPRSLTRGTPSRFLIEALEYLATSDEQYTLAAQPRASIFDPNNNFLTTATLLNNRALTRLDNHYYVSELGGIYRIDEINEGNQGQYFFYLKVVDLGPHNSKLFFELNQNAGSGEFDSGEQSLSLSLFDQSEQCGIIRKPPSIATLSPYIRHSQAKSSEARENIQPNNIDWLFESKGACTAYEFYGRCNPKDCDRWLRDQIKNPEIKAILTDDLSVAEQQAKINAASLSLQN